MQQSKKHHYVPEWYQRRFMKEGQTSYYRLDLYPETVTRPSGEKIKIAEISNKGPGKFFYEIDLYTTKYFGIECDDIERYLFGSIDAEGSKAIAALSSDNWREKIHNHVISFYEYIDAQRLRTPKGLAWLTSVFKPSSYEELLMHMQYVRRMHCTMWAEAFLEIVSAEKSDIKFIVSDNPVTFYNSVCYPGNKSCIYPFDPKLEFQGTRTIFPLDMNHCVIITHRQYARKPGKFKAIKSRNNSRYFDSTLINYDDFIRDRFVDEKRVAAINYIMKQRAERYIAAAERDWLYPEQVLRNTDWLSLDRTFISKSNKLLGEKVEIFLGGSNGELIATQDEYGRKPKNIEEWTAKEKQMKSMHQHIISLLEKNRG